ncbi:hypothetical protein RIF25_01245 [Thermosynechococcaceae cyanobacterium BACA0444]|uniref:Uncharacterized protein n=1 Tax=Pseudocalidococcus azoricus BACA0444 TaxID=2918990 RepID=A0AAE4JY70_9CYAN|nr:hypothetical protein [Pseudocalidococcus azoricus]MDS3859422.1 hypothetical protein [Pseudocalidococcus azoricus BACA0444]
MPDLRVINFYICLTTSVQAQPIHWSDIMPKEKKGNKETKKPKAPTDGSKKPKKDPKRHDGPGLSSQFISHFHE